MRSFLPWFYVICAYPRNTLNWSKIFLKWYNSLIEEELRLRFFLKKNYILQGAIFNDLAITMFEKGIPNQQMSGLIYLKQIFCSYLGLVPNK